MTNKNKTVDNSSDHFESSDKNHEPFRGHEKNVQHMLKQIFDKLNKLEERQKHEFEWFKSLELATKHDLIQTKNTIMSKISEFAARQGAFNDRMDVAITDLQGDVKTLNDLIVQLQGTAGDVTPEDQALLDQIEVRANEIVAKLEALDALTPPAVPPSGSVA